MNSAYPSVRRIEFTVSSVLQGEQAESGSRDHHKIHVNEGFAFEKREAVVLRMPVAMPKAVKRKKACSAVSVLLSRDAYAC